MQKPKEKICEKCGVAFECKVNDISNCQCSQIKLSDDEKLFLEKNSTDCLCLNCLKDIPKLF